MTDLTPMSDSEMDRHRRDCCKSHSYETHTPVCTSNEAVLSRAVPPKSLEMLRQHRAEHGNPLDRLTRDVESGALIPSKIETGQGNFYRFGPPEDVGEDQVAIPVTAQVPLPAPEPAPAPMAQRMIGPQGEWVERRLSPPRLDSPCEICLQHPATLPRAHPSLLIVLRAATWHLEGVRPLRYLGKLEALQLCWIGPFVFLTPGPFWGEAEARADKLDKRRIFTKSLGPFGAVRPWLCINCRLGRQRDVTRRSLQRWTVRSFVVRELRTFVRWLRKKG